MKAFLYCSLLIILCSTSWSERGNPNCSNFHQVSKNLFRSAQPSRKNMIELEEFGVKSIINLRYRCSDQQEIKGSSLKEFHIPIPTKKMSYDDMVQAMKAYHNAPKPALVHCRRGSDRTGCFVACYRILYENYDKQRALDSLLNDGKGYYKNLFPNLSEFVEKLDVDQFKRDVFEP